MITINKGDVIVKGRLPELVQDITHVLNSVYKLMVEELDEQTANEYFVRIGEVSIVLDKEKYDEQLFSLLMDFLAIKSPTLADFLDVLKGGDE